MYAAPPPATTAWCRRPRPYKLPVVLDHKEMVMRTRTTQAVFILPHRRSTWKAQIEGEHREGEYREKESTYREERRVRLFIMQHTLRAPTKPKRESVLFIGTQFSILYTFVYLPA
jgi:hypothetical protein